MMKYTVSIDQCRIQTCSDRDHDSLGEISADQLQLKVESWEVQVDLEKGRLTVRYTDPVSGTTKTLRKPSKLRDGNLHLEVQEDGQPHAYMLAVRLPEALLIRFGITNSTRMDPNRRYTGYLCQQRALEDGEYSFFKVVSDGAVQVSLTDDASGALDPDEPDDMFDYRGGVVYEVDGASWAVVCNATIDSDGLFTDRSITLYTTASNKYLLMLELEKFLNENDCGNFSDYIGEFKNSI